MHIPKTAGTAITMFFYQHGWIDPVDWESWYRNNDHATAQTIRQVVDAGKAGPGLKWKDFYSFAVVRNPFDRLISFWNYKRRSKGQDLHEQSQQLTFPEFVREVADGCRDHLVDQASWILDEHGEIMVDRVIKLEDLTNAWRGLCQNLGIPEQQLRYMNRTHGPLYNHDEYYDDESRRLVEQLYARDFSLFDYRYHPTRKIKPKTSGRIVQFCPSVGSYCGIGTYTEMLCEATGQEAVRDIVDLDEEGVELLHVQHEFSLIEADEFEAISEYCRQHGIRIFTTLHRVERGSAVALFHLIVNALRRKWTERAALRGTRQHLRRAGFEQVSEKKRSARRKASLLVRGRRLFDHYVSRQRDQRRIVAKSERVIVHSTEAAVELRRQGAANVQIMSHPLKLFPTSPVLHSARDGKLHVGYFGFFSAEKDLMSLIAACAQLPNLVLHMMASVPQRRGEITAYAESFAELIRRYDWIDLNLEFLPLDQVVYRLSQNDVNVYLTHSSTHGCSTSGSVRQYLAAKRPVIANRSPMISDLEDVITILNDRRVSTIADAIANFESDTSRIEAYCQGHTWEKLANIYTAGGNLTAGQVADRADRDSSQSIT